MLKWPIQNFLGKMKEESSWKSEVYRLGNPNKAHQNLSKNGQKDSQKKSFLFLMIQLQRELFLVLKMVLLMLLWQLQQAMKMLSVLKFIKKELWMFLMIHWVIVYIQPQGIKSLKSVMAAVWLWLLAFLINRILCACIEIFKIREFSLELKVVKFIFMTFLK